MNKIWYEKYDFGYFPKWLEPVHIETKDGEPILVVARDDSKGIYTFEGANLSKIGIVGDIVWNPSIIPMDVSDMIGKTFTSVRRSKDGDDEIILFSGDGYEYKLFSSENNNVNDVQVVIDDIVGDLSDLENSPILVSELVKSEGKSRLNNDIGTWSFYKFSTIKGYVDVKWWGRSNGYYSEEVNFSRIK